MLIQDDNTLRKYIPNALVTVQGEQSLFDKLQTELQLSELWLTRLIGTLSDDEPTQKIIATDAFRRAVPSLDLVLTPNGFGIVNNNTIAPASRERIDRLLTSLEQNRDFALDSLLQQLLQSDEWKATAQGQYWLQTLFQTPLSLPKELRKDHALDVYEQTHSQLVLIEEELADKFISREVYRRLRTEHLQPLTQMLQAIELQLLAGQPLPYKQLISIVDFIRTHEDDFPEWQTSSTAELYVSRPFQNTKTAGGYWW